MKPRSRWLALAVGRPALWDQVFETATPVVENTLHFAHHLRQLLVTRWSHGRQFIGAAFFVAVLSLGASILRGRYVRASLWSLAFLATVFAFGYVNETRHYLGLLACWAVHPFVRRDETARQSSLPV